MTIRMIINFVTRLEEVVTIKIRVVMGEIIRMIVIIWVMEVRVRMKEEKGLEVIIKFGF